MPIWYQYAPGGKLWLLTGLNSRKHRLIEAAGHVSLMAERLEPTVRYVAVDGPVRSVEPGTDEMTVETAERYLGKEKASAHLEVARREYGASVVVTVNPVHWLSADLGAL